MRINYMSTSLDDLDKGSPAAGAPPADEERVKRILAEMGGPDAQAPPPPMPRVITEPPITMSTGQLRMDPGTARAHVIGNSTPTMADFQSMFQQASPGMAPFHGAAAAPVAPMVPAPVAKSGGWKSVVMQQLRGPVAVAIIVFLLNLPVVTSILSRYASWMYLSSGEISVGGLLVKAVLAAILFAAYQGVTAVVG
jgi:hypothetical protein